MRLTWNAALEETEMVLFESVHKLFKATGVNAQDVSPTMSFLHVLWSSSTFAALADVKICPGRALRHGELPMSLPPTQTAEQCLQCVGAFH